MRGPASAHISFVAGAALAIALAEALLITSARLGARGAFQYVPARLWIVVPLCWVVTAAVLALIATPFFRRFGSLVAVMAMIVMLTVKHLYSRPVLAIVVTLTLFAATVLVARWWMRRPRGAAVGIAVAIAVILASATQIPSTKASSPNRNAPVAPDVVLIFLDTVPYESTQLAPLPVLNRLARESVVFDRAYSSSPWTLPAHLSAVTGLPAHRLGVDFDDQKFDLSTPTLAERFRRRGYRTAAVLSNSFLNRGTGFQRGFDSFEQNANALDLCRAAPGALLDATWPWFAAAVCNWTGSEVTDRAIHHLNGGAQPLFLTLNFMDAHDPYYVERECRSEEFEMPSTSEVAPALYREKFHAAHLAALRCIDRNLGRLLSHVDRDAIVAVLADHGEQFGDHGLVRHGNSLYTQLLHVPMMIRTSRREGRPVTAPISTSMLPQLLEGSFPDSPPVLSSLGDKQWSVIRGKWHFISRFGKEELYDLEADPREEKPVADAVSAELRQEARRQQPLIDAEPGRRFRSLGYVR